MSILSGPILRPFLISGVHFLNYVFFVIRQKIDSYKDCDNFSDSFSHTLSLKKIFLPKF